MLDLFFQSYFDKLHSSRITVLKSSHRKMNRQDEVTYRGHPINEAAASTTDTYMDSKPS